MTQIAIGRKVQRVYARGLGPGCIANTDTVNSVYVGPTTGLSTDSTVLPPQGSIAVGDVDYFAATLGGPAVVVDQIPGASQYNNPVGVQIALSALGLAKDTTVAGQTAGGLTIAQDVASNGVPLLSGAINLLNTGTVAVPASSSSTQGPLPIKQIGYEIFIAVDCNAASTTPLMTVDLQWSDSASGELVAEETWTLAGGSGVNQNYVGTGPTKGDTLNIKFTNVDSVNTTSYQVAFTLNSRVYVRDHWITLSNNPIPNFTRPNMLQSGDVLFQTAPVIGALSGINRILPLYNGIVALTVNNSSQPNSVTVTWQAFSSLSPELMGSLTIAAGASTSAPILVPLPRSVSTIAITNNGASGSIQPSLAAIMVRQPA